MKKFILVVLSLVATNVLAENLTIVSGAPLTASTTIYAQTIASLIPGATLIVAKDCVSAINVAKQMPNAIYLTSNNQIVSATKNNTNCRSDLDEEKIISVSEQHFKVCRLPSSTKTLISPKVKLGGASVTQPKTFADDINKNNTGASVVGIPLKGSVDVITSILNRDIDFGLITAGVAKPYEDSGKIVCDHDTTAKLSTTKKSMNIHYNLTLSEFTLKYILINATANAGDIAKIKQMLTQNKNFEQFLLNGNFYKHNTNITDADAKKINQQLNKEVYFFNQ